jgi:hypothetical protein
MPDEITECDGVHPTTGERCILSEHKGRHRTAEGDEWLDED